MARMIPPFISRDVKSRGERLLYELFAEAPNTEDWAVIHALGVAKHKTRIYGEIDFMVLAPHLGVFCLEVKSGKIERREGVWRFTNRYGDTSEKTRGPFEQAQEAMFSIKSAVRRNFGGASHLNKVLFGYGVMFPDVRYNTEGPDQEGWLVYDRENRKQPISDYIRRLANKTREKVKDANWFDLEKSIPTEDDIEELVGFLRGDFERIITTRQMMEDVEEELYEYTEEQYVVLDQLAGNPRCLFNGATGTGKTMLALESSRRAHFADRRFLLVCDSPLLGEWLKRQQTKAAKGGKGLVLDWRGLEKKLKKGAPKKFDKLIVDEGQEFLDDARRLTALDGLLKGGLKGGEWDIFCDLSEQALNRATASGLGQALVNKTEEEMLKALENKAGPFVRFRLTMNCRNSAAIGNETARAAGMKTPPTLADKTGGEPVQYHFYRDDNEQLRLLKELLKGLRRERIDPERITVLSTKGFAESVAAKLNRKAYRLADLASNISLLGAKKHIAFASIKDYKGLENSHVIIVDLDDLSGEAAKAHLYLGMSRAQAGLDLLVYESCRQDVEEMREEKTGEKKERRGLWE